MRAAVGYGGTPVVAEVGTLEPRARQILMKPRAADMNPMDRTLASREWKPMLTTTIAQLRRFPSDNGSVAKAGERRGVA